MKNGRLIGLVLGLISLIVSGCSFTDTNNYAWSSETTTPSGERFVSTGETTVVSKTWTVNFISDGIVWNTQNVIDGGLLTEPENPAKDNSIFRGWFSTIGKRRFNFSTPIKTSFDLIAKWMQVNCNEPSYGKIESSGCYLYGNSVSLIAMPYLGRILMDGISTTF